MEALKVKQWRQINLIDWKAESVASVSFGVTALSLERKRVLQKHAETFSVSK